MDYEKAYKAVLNTATQWIKDGCTDKERICLKCVFPELRESEDEIHRKWILEYPYDGLRKADEQFKDHFKAAIDWLEKQKELFESGRGLYYYDGEKTTYCGYPATEEKPYDFAMSQQEKQKEQKPAERPSWKPSEEQMCYLKKVYESYDFCDGERDALEALYNDLKKLM